MPIQQLGGDLLVQLVVFDEQDADTAGVVRRGLALALLRALGFLGADAKQLHHDVIEHRGIHRLQQVPVNTQLLGL